MRPAAKSTALWVIRRLRAEGHEALLAGGCVRDMLLGRRSSDYDVATDATPRQVKRVFRRVLLIGAKFGVAMVIHKGRTVEVTTFRTDLSYSDGRRPDGVRFATARDDALRRDFTINGMFYDPVAGKVIDYVGGRRDLARGVIRTIGDPARRFGEDYLRMLRAVRFAVRLDFRIVPATAAAARKHAAKISSISGERVFDELSKMLAIDSAGRALRGMERAGLAEVVLGELFEAGGWGSAVRRVEKLAGQGDLILTVGALLCDLPGKTICRIVRRWGASNELRNALCWFCAHRDDWRTADGIPLCDFKRLMANEHFARLRSLWSVRERMETSSSVCTRRIGKRAGRIDPKKVHPVPLVDGADLKRLGLVQGPRLGRMLRRLYDEQLNEQIITRRQGLARARGLIKTGS